LESLSLLNGHSPLEWDYKHAMWTISYVIWYCMSACSRTGEVPHKLW